MRSIIELRLFAFKADQWNNTPGPGCSKLTMSLVNDSLKFTSSDTQICWNFLLKKCEYSAKATHIFFQQKNIRILCIESAKTVNEMILNELVKLTTLWTTGPRGSSFCCCLHDRWVLCPIRLTLSTLIFWNRLFCLCIWTHPLKPKGDSCKSKTEWQTGRTRGDGSSWAVSTGSTLYEKASVFVYRAKRVISGTTYEYWTQA